MRRPVGLVLLAGLAAAGCGGGGNHASQAPSTAPTSATPVAQQLQVALQGALHPSGGLETYSPPRVPMHANVRACSGPPQGRAGVYHCTLMPSGHGFAPRSVSVSVKPDGTWSITVPHNPRERIRSLRMMWGTGLHMPSR